jgi:hypothetical protein
MNIVSSTIEKYVGGNAISPKKKIKIIRNIVSTASPATDEVVHSLANIAPEEIYINSFTDKEKKAYLIAKTHLETSFSLSRSNGFIQFATK